LQDNQLIKLNAMRSRILIISMLLLTAVAANAADIRIALFYGKSIQSVVFTTVEGEYLLSGDGRQVAVIRKGTMIHMETTENGIALHDTLQAYGIFNRIECTGVSVSNIFLLKPVYPAGTAKESEDDLTIEMAGGSLRMINKLALEKYIPGSVETEGGPGATVEFYKAQAVLIRTFAFKNFTRHAEQGFNLCDGIHCQAYNGKSRMNKSIYDAVTATKDLILANGAGEPVTTAYHANCGGITSSAAMAWNRDLPYLVPVHDPFCNESSYRNWRKELSLDEWKKYLQGKGIEAASALPDAGNQPGGREKFFVYGKAALPLTMVRADLGLRSAYFTLAGSNGKMIINGHGYGHGVGMCQQGAMEMARKGYCYVDILMFYFGRGVRIAQRQ
jgi:stage II sporulation protein D